MTVYDDSFDECTHPHTKRWNGKTFTFTECQCGAFRCKRCEQWRGPELGMADDAPALCDHCWAALGLGDESPSVSP